jgi:hypothetical protein
MEFVLMSLKLFKFRRPHAGIFQYSIQALEGADSFAKLKHRSITGHVKLPNLDDSFLRRLRSDPQKMKSALEGGMIAGNGGG